MPKAYDGPEVEGRKNKVYLLEFDQGPAVVSVCSPDLPIRDLIDITMRDKEDVSLVSVRECAAGALLVNDEPTLTHHMVMDYIATRDARSTQNEMHPGEIVAHDDVDIRASETTAAWLLKVHDGTEIVFVTRSDAKLSVLIEFMEKDGLGIVEYRQVYAGTVTINPALVAPGWKLVLNDIDIRHELESSGLSMN